MCSDSQQDLETQSQEPGPLNHLLSAGVSRFQSVPDFHRKKGKVSKKSNLHFPKPGKSVQNPTHNILIMHNTAVFGSHHVGPMCFLCFLKTNPRHSRFLSVFSGHRFSPSSTFLLDAQTEPETNAGFPSSRAVSACISACTPPL